MPGFIKGKRDEKIWSKAKRRAAHSLGKSSVKGDDYALVNWLYHKMKKAHPMGRLPKHYDESCAPVKVVARERVEFDWFCPHCEEKIQERGSLFYNKAEEQFEHRQCGGSIMLPKSEDNKKKCKCAAGAPCDCWAFAPFFGDGMGHSGATIPKNNVAAQDAHHLPRGVNNGEPVDGQVPPGQAPAAPVTASKALTPDEEIKLRWELLMKDRETLPAEEGLMKSGLAGLNEGLDFMTRVFTAPTIVVPEDPADNPNHLDLSQVMNDDLDGGQMLYLGMGDEDPLAPIAYDDTDCSCSPVEDPDYATGFDDLSAAIDAMDDEELPPEECVLREPDGWDIVKAVQTLLDKSVGARQYN